MLFDAGAQTLLEVAANPRHLGARIGFLGILHTWGQNLRLHPHLHCVVPGGGFDPSYSRWVHPKYPFFLPVKVLSRVFRGKFLDLLQRVPRQRRPDFSSTLVHTLLQQDWVVYAKPAFGGPAHVLRYLGRYTHRVAISNQRLLSFDGHSVSFRWKDYAHGNKQRIMTLSATEFLRRFCQHVLPRGFVRIRHFGYLASAHRPRCSHSLARSSPKNRLSGQAMLSVVKGAAAFSRVPKLRCQSTQNCLASQSWRFVAHEVRVISFKKEALQTLSIPKYLAWNPLAFRPKEIDESVDCGGKTLVKQRIRLGQFEICGQTELRRFVVRRNWNFAGKCEPAITFLNF